jgi:hypothetical protein
MHVNDRRFSWGALGLAVGLCHGGAVMACEDIAIVARDGRYIVVSGDDLTEKDVGNLWWMGIRTIDDVVRQSTLRRAGFLVELRIDASTGEAHQSELAVLQDLGRNLPLAGADVPILAIDFDQAWWVDDSNESELIVVRGRSGAASMTLYSSELETRVTDLPLSVPLGSGVSCRDGDRIIVGALRHRAIIADATFTVDTLPSATPRDSRSLGVAPAGCIGVVGSLRDAQPNADTSTATAFDVRTVDLATNEAGPVFQKDRPSAVALFAQGSLLFEQDRDATPEGEVGFRLTPTGRVRVIDVQTGSVVRAAELPSAGPISRLFCRNDRERLVMAAEGEIHLIDLASLGIVASRQIPFDRYFVF